MVGSALRPTATALKDRGRASGWFWVILPRSGWFNGSFTSSWSSSEFHAWDLGEAERRRVRPTEWEGEGLEMGHRDGVILENPAYTGDFIGGRYAYGKYHQIKGDRIEKVSGGKRGEKPQAEWIIHRDHHQSIVSRESYERAQAIFHRGDQGHRTPQLQQGVSPPSRRNAPLWEVRLRDVGRHEAEEVPVL